MAKNTNYFSYLRLGCSPPGCLLMLLAIAVMLGRRDAGSDRTSSIADAGLDTNQPRPRPLQTSASSIPRPPRMLVHPKTRAAPLSASDPGPATTLSTSGDIGACVHRADH